MRFLLTLIGLWVVCACGGCYTYYSEQTHVKWVIDGVSLEKGTEYVITDPLIVSEIDRDYDLVALVTRPEMDYRGARVVIGNQVSNVATLKKREIVLDARTRVTYEGSYDMDMQGYRTDVHVLMRLKEGALEGKVIDVYPVREKLRIKAVARTSTGGG